MGRLDEPTGPRRVTIADVARALGIAPATVSNAYNRPDQLSPALRERVFATAAALGYQPNPAARGLRRGRSGAIGVLSSYRLSYAFSDPAYVQFLRGVVGVAETEGLSLTLLPGTPRAVRDPESVSAAVVDGFLLYSMADDDPLVQAVLERRLPLVSVDAPVLPQASCIAIDDANAAAQAAAHLLERGVRQPGILALPLGIDAAVGTADLARQRSASYHIVRARLEGYAAACATAGVPWTDVHVEVCAENSVAEGATALARLLDARPECSGVLAMSDQLALGALAAMQERGLRVPDDLALVGFDDIPEASLARPPLTTMHQPHEAKGRRATELLIAAMRGDDMIVRERLAATLIVRGSSG